MRSTQQSNSFNALNTAKSASGLFLSLLLVLGLSACSSSRHPATVYKTPSGQTSSGFWGTQKKDSRYAQEYDGAPVVDFDPSKVIPVVPKIEPLSAYGNKNPYEVWGKKYYLLPSAKNYRAVGTASWYGTKFQGYRTSSGEPYDMFKLTAAHKSLPLPSYLRVTNVQNGKQIIVRVNDRGPFHDDRLIDLSYAAAHLLGITQRGTGQVKIEAITPGNPAPVVTKTVPRPVEPLKDNKQGLYVQVGAYRQSQVAQSVQKKVSPLTQHPITISKTVVNNGVVHRVLIGPLPNRSDGDALALSIREQKIGDAIVKQL